MKNLLDLIFKGLNTEDIHGNPFITAKTDEMYDEFYQSYVKAYVPSDDIAADDFLSLSALIEAEQRNAFEIGFAAAMQLKNECSGMQGGVT